jgi:2-hydroxychromene-2-carboxylate isomerase
VATAPADSEAVFYYDLGSPESYLVAERVGAALPVVAVWEPVLAARLDGPPADPDRVAIERIAATRGLQPVRWPSTWPPDTHMAMLTATYAKRVGRAVAFSLAAFRQAYAGGRDLSDRDTVLIAAAACEMHPAAVLKGIELRSVTEALDTAIARARAAGVKRTPAIQVGDRLFVGDTGLDDAVGALR